ncbi:MAG: hypothetical protein COU07_02790 [Candidatus Harrisonbacteria bacterium CG10_big_fil_rev_8_21_14_0_10_40_38]|uniref:Uncharacterized protein n=1 Tax=Candidatus Harrisonbacteria bacterium CG10_big_fil_rev_8_21_14_0_10_40_38 TaxID=1974583 RepID=A0A2H0URS8_9BACT|nr:MAG: hypothetical protein COU07_02790 [Candidatus Harrisonbacteria bacterium CG10_big_fil_rev_8_21_14_0_10_40_38]
MIKIPETLKSFSSTPSLLLVAGTSGARFFVVSPTGLTEVDSFFIDKPKYSDNEGFFVRSGGGKRFGSGSVKVENSNELLSRFVNSFADRSKKLINSYKYLNKVFLFVPSHLAPIVRSSLPKDAKNKLVAVISGNYLKFHPLDIAKKAWNSTINTGTRLTSETASKLLNRKFLNFRRKK